MIRTVARVVGVAVLAVGVLAPAGAAPHKSSGSGSTPCNDGTVSWSPTTLWPPNHKMQTITIGYTDNDNDGDMIGVMVGSIHDNQSSADGSNALNGSGQPTDKQGLDWRGPGTLAMGSDPGTATTTAQVRADRSGPGKGGRVSTIALTVRDTG